MPYSLYKHTSPSGKVYIGITCLNPSKRWQNGGGYKNNPHFTRAIAFYGWDKFKHEILATGLTKERAEELEVRLIKEYQSTDPRHGYNIDAGGSTGTKHSQATRRKIGEANKRRVWTVEARARVGASSRGRIPNEETRRKMGAAHRGQFHSEEAKAKIRAAKQKPVVCLDTGMQYGSVEEAAKAIGASPSLVAGVCRGVHTTTRGLRFQFLNKEKEVTS